MTGIVRLLDRLVHNGTGDGVVEEHVARMRHVTQCRHGGTMLLLRLGCRLGRRRRHRLTHLGLVRNLGGLGFQLSALGNDVLGLLLRSVLPRQLGEQCAEALAETGFR